MATEMQNIDIRDFPTAGSVSLSDYVILSMFDGTAGKMTINLFRDAVTKGIAPAIGEDGIWYVNDISTGVPAEGLTPEFRKSDSGIEFRYTREDDNAWRPLISYSDLRLRYGDLTEEQVYALRMRYEDLTSEQIDALRLKYVDLTEEQIAELQRPATDAVSELDSYKEVLKQEVKEAVDNSSLIVLLEENGDLVVEFGEGNTTFQKGYIEDDGDVVLEFNFS